MSDTSGTTSPEPVPQRIGDAERDQAATYLREALAQGRLEQSEFDERVESALRARTQADLDPLFQDLPGPKPGQALSPAAGFTAPPWQQSSARPPADAVAVPPPSGGEVASRSTSRVLETLAWAAWPITMIVLFATSWQFWWLIFVPIAISSMVGGRHAQRHRDRDRDH